MLIELQLWSTSTEQPLINHFPLLIRPVSKTCLSFESPCCKARWLKRLNRNSTAEPDAFIISQVLKTRQEDRFDVECVPGRKALHEDNKHPTAQPPGRDSAAAVAMGYQAGHP